MDNLIKQNKIVLSFFFFLIAKGLDRTVLTGSCGPTPILAVHGINKKSSSLVLKNRFSSRFPIFTVRPLGPVRFWKPCYRLITQPTSLGAKLNCHISNQVTTLGPLSISVTRRGRKIVPTRDSALGEPAVQARHLITCSSY